MWKNASNKNNLESNTPFRSEIEDVLANGWIPNEFFGTNIGIDAICYSIKSMSIKSPRGIKHS